MPDLVFGQALDFLGGQDASHIPDRVPDNAYYAGINISVKKGCLQPRWGFSRITLKFPEGGVEDSLRRFRTWAEIFQAGKFQAMAPYNIAGQDYLVVIISGYIFLVHLNSYKVTVINAAGPAINSRTRRINWSSAERFFIIYDYPAPPIILDGFTARYSNLAGLEVPISTNGTYNQSRLFITNASNDYTAGDPIGVGFPDAPISFQEIMMPASTYYGQIFGLPTSSQSESINAMGFLQASDASTGIGPLILGTNRAIYACATNQPRNDWDAGQFVSLLTYNAGTAGPRALCNVNSDMFFMSADGHIRTLSMSRDEQKAWARVPMSREVEIWLKYWDKDLMSLGFVSYFNNKVFFSANPYRISVEDYQTRMPISDYANGGLVVLELDNFVQFGQSSKPTWAGLWTGIRPMDMSTINNRCFVISKDSHINHIYEVDPEINYDTADDKIRYVKSVVYTKEHDFGDPFVNKEAHSIDLNFDNLQGDFKVQVEYKPSHCPAFLPWRSFSHTAPWRACCFPSDRFINGYAHQMIRDLTMGSPDSDAACDPITSEFYRIFRKAQLRIVFSGKYWELHEYRIKALPIIKEENDTSCVVLPTIAIPDSCDNDWFIEDFESCQPPQVT